MLGAVGEVDKPQELAYALLPLGRFKSAQAQRDLNIFRCSENGDQAEGLEDEADRLAPVVDESLVGKRRDFDSVDRGPGELPRGGSRSTVRT